MRPVCVVPLVLTLLSSVARAVDIDLALTDANVTVYGASAAHQAGFSVAVGDINGDSNDDVVIASYGAMPLSGQRKGEIDILWGPLGSSAEVDLGSPGLTGVSRVFGKSSDNPIFCRLAVGDINGDQRDDILYAQPYGPDSWLDGMAYLILGSDQFPTVLDLQLNPSNVIRILGAPWSGALGWAVSFGDMNNDGFDEAILSAPRLTYGEIYIIRGGTTLPSLIDMSSPPSNVTRLVDHRANNWTGESLACRDVDNDGFDDLLIGSPGNVAGARYGMASLVFGRGNLPSLFLLSDPSFRVIEFFGESYPDGRLGMSVQLGNVDGDTSIDVILSAPYADEDCFDCGTNYVVYDAAELPDTVLVGQGGVPQTVLHGEANYYAYGSTLAGLNWAGDARDDVIVRSKPDSSPSARARLVVVPGASVLPASLFLHSDATLTRIYEATAGDHLGRGIAIGDINDDGMTDIVTGADFADPLGRSNAGIVYILFGSGTTTAAAPRQVPRLVAHASYPNPFSKSTLLPYELSTSAQVHIAVFDVHGRQIIHLSQGERAPGLHAFSWSGIDATGQQVPSGVYFYRVSAGASTVQGKFLIIR